MPGMQRFEADLAAGAAVPNLLAGGFLERLGARREVVSVYGVIDVIAALAGLVTVEFRLGNTVIADAAVVPMFTALLGPHRNEHKITVGRGDPLDLVQVRLFNGGGVTAPYRFMIEAVAM